MQARDSADESPVGSFTVSDTDQSLSNCSIPQVKGYLHFIDMSLALIPIF